MSPRTRRAAPVGFVLAGGLAYLAPDLATHGIALDGLVYGAIGKAMAQGAGSFWFPPHFEGYATSFHDHPPLGLWLTGLWMRWIGAAFYAEKILGLAMLGITCALLARLTVTQRRLAPEAAPPIAVVLAVFLLLPITTYAAKNGYLENIATPLSTLAVLLAVPGPRPWLRAIGVGACC